MTTIIDSASSVKPTRKPRPAPYRAVRFLIRPDDTTDLWAALQITVGNKSAVYLLHPIPADFGMGYQVEKLDDSFNTVEQYDINLMGQESSCTCPGHSFHGHCKHVDALTTLQARNALPCYHRSSSSMAKNDPESYRQDQFNVGLDYARK